MKYFANMGIKIACFIVLAGMSAFLLAACQSQPAADPALSSSADGGAAVHGNQPVRIENYNRTVEFAEAPQRAVVLNGHTAEIMLALGLDEQIVGVSYEKDGLSPQYIERMEKLPYISEKYPSLEVLLGLNPDFVYARESAFKSANAVVASVEELEQMGITPYVAKGTYVTGATMEDVYEDFINLGKIFRIESKANEIVADMKRQIDEVRAKIGHPEKPVRVFVLDQGGENAFTAGKALQSHLIRLAGGINVFEEELDKNWARVSWEEVIRHDPEVIVINDYGNVPAADKIEQIKNNAALTNVSAVKNNRFVTLPLSAAFEGVRNVEAVQILAKGFYPELFK